MNSDAVLITPNPISTGVVFQDRYEGNYNGKATITGVDIVNSQTNPSQNGSLAVHMRGIVNGQPVEIVDYYGKKKNPTTTDQVFAQQMLNRATGAQKSAGVASFNEPIDVKLVRQKVYQIFTELIGKQVTISQYTRQGFTRPNINYKFDEASVSQSVLPGMINPAMLNQQTVNQPAKLTAEDLANIPF